MTDTQKPNIEVCLALGTNLGDKLANLHAAKEELAPYIKDMKLSSIYETDPAYELDQPHFYNAALRGVTHLDPRALLFTVKDIELAIGRTPTYRYGPRVIDIDIIFYGDQKVDAPDLIIPHLLMAERDFVLSPLCDIASDWVHPILGKTVKELLDSLEGPNSARRREDSF